MFLSDNIVFILGTALWREHDVRVLNFEQERRKIWFDQLCFHELQNSHLNASEATPAVALETCNQTNLVSKPFGVLLVLRSASWLFL